MKFSSMKALVCAAVLMLGTASVLAEDIDLYEDGGGTSGVPNLLIILDNAANFSASTNGLTCSYADGSGAPSLAGTLAGIEQCAMFNAVYSLPPNAVNLGLMVFNTTHFTSFGCPAGGNGGCLVQPLALMTPASKAAFLTFVKTWSLTSSNPNYMKANGEATSAAMQEAWAYYAGQTGLSGRSYSGIQPGSGCQKNFVVYIGNAYDTNGTPGDGSSTSPSAALQNAPGVTPAQLATIPLRYPDNEACNTSNPFYNSKAQKIPESDSSGLWADEWARYMYGTDIFGTLDGVQNIRTYTIGVLGPSCKPDYPALLTSMAGQGHGKYYAAYTYSELYQAFLSILNEVQSINSVFASSSLPVSVNNQGTYLNQVFIGMFRPDASASPRWSGNLKQYQFGVRKGATGVELFLADAESPPKAAISAAGSGFISPTAISFWTQIDPSASPDNIGATGGFWINNPMGTPLSGFDSPDGEVVEKGGVGQQIRLARLKNDYSTFPNTPNSRNLYTCTNGSGLCAANALLSATPFSTTNSDITTASLGSSAPPVAVTSIGVSFSGSTSTATVTLGSTPSPALASGQTVTIAGSKYPELNGPYSITTTGATTFTYTPLATDPPSPATVSYTASLQSAGALTLTSLTRSGTTATATTQSAHGYVAGQTVTIASSSPSAANARYYGSFQVTPTGVKTFTYTIVEGPATPSAGGTVTIGAKNYAITSLTRTGTEVDVTISFSGPNPTGSSATISGTSVTNYNNTWATTKKQGGACPSAPNGTTLCFTIATTPPFPDTDTGLSTYPNTSSVSIASGNLSRGTTTCTGTYAGDALVTATTTDVPGFVAGNTINVGGVGGVIGANENLYTGQFAVQSLSVSLAIPPVYTFTYYAPTSPGCSDTSAGLTAAPAGIDRNTMIRWVRGQDNQGDELGPGSGVTIRPSVHGDILHSRPTVVNYGSGTGVVVFYGGNDGVFRAVNGNQTASIGSVPPGGELWGFIPKEFFGKLARLAYNSPALKLPNTPTGIIPTPQPKDYFFDGNSSVYQNGATVYLFLSARRGGRLIYALDVTDPANPKFLWKKGCTSLTDNTTCDSGFGELGQTWSTPKAANVKGYSNPVVIFGAGYHGGYDSSGNRVGEDAEPPATDGMGRGIFILDALDGHIVWQATSGGSSNSCKGTPCALLDMTYSIPADITLLNRDFDAGGLIDRLYAADAGGNIWRVDLEPTSGNTPANWQVTQLASLGGAGSFKRKILAPVDVVVTKTFDIVLTGTGDREHPLFSSSGGTYSVVNRFYALKDMKTGSDATPWTSSDTIVDNSSSTSSAAPSPKTLFDATSLPYDNSLSGFYIILQNAGEKIVNGPTSVGGFAYFGTNQPPIPSATSCKSNLGTALGYQVNLFTGTTATVEFDGGGLPPSPVAGLVNVVVDGKDVVVPFLLGGGNPSPDCKGPDCTSSIGGGKPPIPVPPARKRVYWYIDKHDN